MAVTKILPMMVDPSKIEIVLGIARALKDLFSGFSHSDILHRLAG